MKQRSRNSQPISRTEKARLHRERVAALARRQRQREQSIATQCRSTLVDDEIYEDEFDEIERNYIEVDEVIGLLRSIERNRKALRDDAITLQRWLKQSSDLAQTWREFLAAGGVTADDFEHFAESRFRHRPIRQKRHLRLILRNKPHPRMLQANGNGNGGNDAA